VHADALLRPWFVPLTTLVPGARLFDAHTHTGANDPDGFRCSADELLAALDDANARAVVFTMAEPDGYPPANDRVLAEAAASGGRLVAFCRLDPRADPVAEARRCVEAGARGIKLHPRANTFDLKQPGVEPVVAFAHERSLPVLIHAGRGIPALGRDALELAARYPDAKLVLAHAAVSDLAWIWRHAGERPNVFVDTAWWSATDLLTAFSLLPPGRILFGSDVPYGSTLQMWLIVARCGLQAGLDAEQLRAVAGGQLERLLAGGDPLELGPPPGPAPGAGLLLDRVHDYLLGAVGRMLVGNPGGEMLDLARLACEVGDDAPEAPVCRSIVELIELAGEARELRAQGGPEPDRVARSFPAIHVAIAAAAVARTPRVPVPEPSRAVDVGERER
jgi:predicted TIM-barrel fold metal-dependent hydrolase